MTIARRWLFRLRTLFAVTALVVAVLVGYGVYEVYYVVHVVVRDCYAEWWAADMVIEYMKENSGGWPTRWEDLSEPYEVLTKQAGAPWTIAEIRERVEIRFDADPTILKKSALVPDQPPFKVIYLRSGKQHHWEGKEPNRMIWDYLHESFLPEDSPSAQVERAE